MAEHTDTHKGKQMPIYTNPTVGTCAAWPHAELTADWQARANVWREITPEHADYCLNVLPPLDWRGGAFMVGEAHDHDERGRAVYCGVIQINGQHYARNVARADFAEACAQLRAHLAQKVTA